MTTQEILQAAQGAKLPLALADADTKNAALEAMAVALIAAQDKILDANKQDVENARGRVSDVMLDRLALTPSVGDFLFQEKCEKRMAELLSGGTTVILVSHSIDQIERMCNKVAWLDHGHLRRIGATKEITAEYRRFEKKDAMPAKVTEE